MAYGTGSTTSAAPKRRAATMPAPKVMPPCVSVGPSSTTATRLPSIVPPSSVSDERARITSARGLRLAMSARTISTAPGSAESTLLMTTTSAIRRLASPGW